MKLNFRDRVFAVVKKIPKGRTMSYQEVARLAGSPRASRAVGNILNKNFDPAVPCHRVVRSDGTPGGYNRGARRKINMLKKEGATKSGQEALTKTPTRLMVARRLGE